MTPGVSDARVVHVFCESCISNSLGASRGPILCKVREHKPGYSSSETSDSTEICASDKHQDIFLLHHEVLYITGLIVWGKKLLGSDTH